MLSIGSNMMYSVNLISGDVTTQPDGIVPKHPHSKFRNEHQAGYLALGICIQNLSEKAFTTERPIEDLTVTFTMLGSTHTVTKKQAIKGRELLKATYPEYFI